MADDFLTNGSSPGASIDSFFQSPKNVSVSSSLSKIRFASMDKILNNPGFIRVSNETLVRVSQNDFWKLGEDDEGVFIERLVDDDSGPVKG